MLAAFFLSLLLPCILFLVFFRKRRLDPYDLFHLTLNQTESNFPPQTEWLNMGYWKNTDRFPEACKALALRLLEHAEYNGGAVLDVGHGTGDSLLLFLAEPSIPRPSRLAGITSIVSHHLQARNRVGTCLSTFRGTLPKVTLHRGDAVFRKTSRLHPLDVRHLDDPYDFIMALDCAYHFQTRELFLNQAFNVLCPGGRIGLADIIFEAAPRPWVNWVRGYFAPAENLMSMEKYRDTMYRLGYSCVEFEDITDDVYPGFLAFLKSKGGLWQVFAWFFAAFIAPTTRFVLVAGTKP